MKRILTYLPLCLMVVCGYSQIPSTWMMEKSVSPTHVLTINQNRIVINGTYATYADSNALSVFARDGKGNYISVGSSYLSKNDSLVTLYAYAKDITSKYAGFEQNAPFAIFYWDNLKKCQTEFTSTDSLLRLQQNSRTAIEIQGYYPKIWYDSSTYHLKSGKNPVPTISRTILPPQVLFSCNSKNIALNQSSGEIDLLKTQPGTYTIRFRSALYCLLSDSQTIRIVDDTLVTPPKIKLDLSKLKLHQYQPGCKTRGSLTITESSIIGLRPLTYHLSLLSSGDTVLSNSGYFDQLHEGSYQLTVADSGGAKVTFGSLLVFKIQDDCRNYLLTPGARDGLQTLFIPEQGTARIVDKEGKLIKQLSVPGEWDVTDSRGMEVPMGDYFLFINEQQNKVITVLR